MKKLVLLTVLFNFIGCQKIKDLIKADFSYTDASTSFTIPISGTTTSWTLNQNLEMNLDSLIKANSDNQLDINNIKSMKIKSIELIIENPDTPNNFQNLSSARLDFKSNLNSSLTNLGTIADNPDIYAPTINLPINSSIDLLNYVKGASLLTYSASVTIRKPTTKDLKTKVKVSYQITAGL